MRLGDALADGRELALAARAIRNQRDHQRWRDAVRAWRSSTADTLEAGFATTVTRHALLEIWSTNAPVGTSWLDSFETEREQLQAALDFAERVRGASSRLVA